MSAAVSASAAPTSAPEPMPGNAPGSDETAPAIADTLLRWYTSERARSVGVNSGWSTRSSSTEFLIDWPRRRTISSMAMSVAPARCTDNASATRHDTVRAIMPTVGSSSAVAVDDTTAREVVRRQLDLHAVARQDADVVPAHLARDVGQHLVVVVESHAEHCVGECFGDLSLELDLLFFVAH